MCVPVSYVLIKWIRIRAWFQLGHNVHATVYVSVCLSLAVFLRHCMAPGVTFGNGRGCLPVVHYWTDLQWCTSFVAMTTHAPNAKCQRAR